MSTGIGSRPASSARPVRPAAGSAGRVSALVLAAGSGSRFTGSFIPKQFVSLMGKPILAYVLETYQNLDLVDDITLVVNARAKWYSLRQSMSRCSSMPERPNRNRQMECSNPPAGSNSDSQQE